MKNKPDIKIGPGLYRYSKEDTHILFNKTTGELTMGMGDCVTYDALYDLIEGLDGALKFLKNEK